MYSWSCDWNMVYFKAMELLVEKCVSSGGANMSPGDALRRVFESISSGLLLPGTILSILRGKSFKINWSVQTVKVCGCLCNFRWTRTVRSLWEGFNRCCLVTDQPGKRRHHSFSTGTRAWSDFEISIMIYYILDKQRFKRWGGFDINEKRFCFICSMPWGWLLSGKSIKS